MNFKSTPNNLSYLLRKPYSSLLWDFEQVHFWRKEGHIIPPPASKWNRHFIFSTFVSLDSSDRIIFQNLSIIFQVKERGKPLTLPFHMRIKERRKPQTLSVFNCYSLQQIQDLSKMRKLLMRLKLRKLLKKLMTVLVRLRKWKWWKERTWKRWNLGHLALWNNTHFKVWNFISTFYLWLHLFWIIMLIDVKSQVVFTEIWF